MEKQLSKTLSYFLRHAPQDGGLTMDDQGFVPLDQLVRLLRDRHWDTMTEDRLIQLIDDPATRRFERKGHAVRARYGHSLDVDLKYPRIPPPQTLYHGTFRDAWENIREEGLRPMTRQYVHLSTTPKDARRVGRRHDPEPVLLEARIPADASIALYRAGPVVLCRRVPVGWIARLE